MGESVVVLGSGYGGVKSVQTLEDSRRDVDLTWVSDRDYHLVLHEVHRAVRDPSVGEKITIPVGELKSDRTDFVEGRVVGISNEDRRVHLRDGGDLDYDYLVVALGTETAFYGIPGVEEHSHTIKSLDRAVEINREVSLAAAEADSGEPARVVVGGAGLSGVQTAGEVAEYRDDNASPIEVVLVEALDDVMPNEDPRLRSLVKEKLNERRIRVLTGDPVAEVDGEAIHLEERGALKFDVFVWTGGITGPEELAKLDVGKEHNRLETGPDLRTSDERIFAVGDDAVVNLNGSVAPPKAQAAWEGAEVAAENVIRAMEGRKAKKWRFRDKGTVVSIGEDAVADVKSLPGGPFGSSPAALLKKLVGARWIASVTSWRRAMRSWNAL